MSELEKCFVKPKVRFSKSAESPEHSNVDRVFVKPKIRSLTTVRPRVKILKAPLTNDEFEQSSSPDGICSRRSGGDSAGPPAADASPVTACTKEIPPSPENRCTDDRRPTEGTNSCKNLGGRHQPTRALKSILVEKRASSEKNARTNLAKESKKLSTSFSDKIIKSSELEGTTGCSARTKTAGKENVPSKDSRENVLPKVPDNTPRTSNSTTKSNISQKSRSTGDKWSSSGVAVKTIAPGARPTAQVKKVTTSASFKVSTNITAPNKTGGSTVGAGAERRKSLATKSPTVELMACMRSARTVGKHVPARKTVLRDAAVNPSAVYVGPGLPRSGSSDFAIQEPFKDERAMRSRSEILSSNKLARPEYNSITSTMRDLLEARSHKVIDNVKHLPAIYRRLVNGKVSSALDFGANETVYRDLVDLTIDEKQLPARLTRSKDPAPRQRDITPKLSDFFVPSNDEEYCRAVIARPPSPCVPDNWNPYKISNRIFSWKESLDREL